MSLKKSCVRYQRENKSVCDTPEISVVPTIPVLGNNPLSVPGRGVCVSILPMSGVSVIIVDLGKNPALGDPMRKMW